jgi:hypothetical protein
MDANAIVTRAAVKLQATSRGLFGDGGRTPQFDAFEAPPGRRISNLLRSIPASGLHPLER